MRCGSVDKRIESKSREELAKILKHSSINELVEVTIDAMTPNAGNQPPLLQCISAYLPTRVKRSAARVS